VEKDDEGNALDVQRASWDGCRKADVPFGLQTHPLHCSASGYYEWRAAEGGKQPYFISAANGEVLSITGLWDQWKVPETGETISSCTMIVTAANDFTRCIHDRMPGFLADHDLDGWLTGKAGVELLRPAANDLLRMWPVLKRVNVSGRGDDGPSLIEPVEAIAECPPIAID
jgi:putative SOS response-associated peptidase YedK